MTPDLGARPLRAGNSNILTQPIFSPNDRKEILTGGTLTEEENFQIVLCISFSFLRLNSKLHEFVELMFKNQ